MSVTPPLYISCISNTPFEWLCSHSRWRAELLLLNPSPCMWETEHDRTSACEQQQPSTAVRSPLLSPPAPSLRCPVPMCSSNMTFVLTHRQCCWIEECNYGALSVSQPIWRTAASESGVNAQNTVGVSIKNIVSPNIIFQLLCSFGNLTEVVTYVKGLWHFKHVITPFNHLSQADKATVTMCFIRHCEHIILWHAYLASCANHAECLMW